MDVPGRPRADGDDEAAGEESLRQSRAFLDSIVENLPNMVFVKDAAELRFVRFNRFAEDLLGYSRDEMVGKNDYDFFPPEEADHFTRMDREVLAGRAVVDIPAERIDTRLRGQRILHTRKIPILGEDGQAEFLLGISEDITERVGAEEALRDRQETLSAVFQASPDAIMILTPDLAMTEVSGAMERIDAVTASDRLERGLLESVHPDDAGALAREIAALVGSDAGTMSIRYRTRHADGHWVPVEASGRGLRDRGGAPSGAVLLVRDISERVLAEERLKAERETVGLLQRALLPRLSAFEGIDIGAIYHPAGSDAVVGGDWYDAFVLPNGDVVVVVGDIAGHGFAAASLMGQLRSAARTLAALGRSRPADLLTGLNDVLSHYEPDEMATAIVAHLDPRSGQLTWSVAGHPPLVIRGRDRCTALEGPPDGPPLGTAPGVVYSERTAWVGRDDLVVLYTDGLIERRAESLGAGIGRLVAAVDEVAGSSSLEAVCASICDRLVPDGSLLDDVCVVAIRCVGMDAPADRPGADAPSA